MTRTLTALALVALASPLLAQQPGGAAAARRSGIGPSMLPSEIQAPAGKAITDDQFAALRRAANGGQDPKPLPPKKHGFSLVDMSSILTMNDTSTILPKGSIIVCPEAYRGRIVSTPSSNVIPWQEFLAANRAWIATAEVDIKQVRGEKPLPDAQLTAFKSRGLMIVATLNGCPVTVLPYSPDNQPTSTQ